jgi:hypothetical protein
MGHFFFTAGHWVPDAFGGELHCTPSNLRINVPFKSLHLDL